MTVTPVGNPSIPTARQLHQHMRRSRHRHHPRSLPRRIFDSSDKLYSAVLVIGLLVDLDRTALGGPAISLPPATAWTILLFSLLALTAATKALLMVGPLLVNAPAQTWLLSTPTSRTLLLRPRFATLVGTASASLGYLVTLLVPLDITPRAALPYLVPAGVVTGAAVATSTVLIQLTSTVRIAQRVLSAALVAETAATVAALLAGTTLPPPRLTTEPLSIVLLAAIPLTGALLLVTYKRLRHATRATLTHGAEIATAASAALSWMDLTVLSETLAIRSRRTAGRARSRRIRGSRTIALLHTERARLLRSPATILTWLLLACVPYLAHAVLAPPLIASCYTVTCFLATNRLATSLRTILRHDTLRRALGGHDRDLALSALATPTAGALIWCAITFPALPPPHLTVAILACASALAVTYRIATKPPMDYSSPLLDTPYGTIPVNVVRQLARGPALLLAIVIVQYVITININHP